MYLKQPVNSVDFFKTIDCCTGDVLLHTKESDILNLRSQLCRFIFAVASTEGTLFDDAWVTCTEPSDYELLKSYLTQRGSGYGS